MSLLQRQSARELRVFDHLNRVKDADSRQIAGQSGPLVSPSCEADCRRRGLNVGPARATNRLQSGGDVYAWIKLLRFQQPIVCVFELFALDVKTGESQTLPRRLFKMLCDWQRSPAAARASELSEGHVRAPYAAV